MLNTGLTGKLDKSGGRMTGVLYGDNPYVRFGSTQNSHDQMVVRPHEGLPDLDDGYNYIFLQQIYPDDAYPYIRIGINGLGQMPVEKANYAENAKRIDGYSIDNLVRRYNSKRWVNHAYISTNAISGGLALLVLAYGFFVLHTSGGEIVPNEIYNKASYAIDFDNTSNRSHLYRTSGKELVVGLLAIYGEWYITYE